MRGRAESSRVCTARAPASRSTSLTGLGGFCPRAVATNGLALDTAIELDMWTTTRVSCMTRTCAALTVCVAALFIAWPAAAFASSTGGAVMPWTAPLQSLLDNLSGPTARIIGAIAFVVGGALWAFTRHEEGARRFGQAIVGIAIMIGAANIVAALGFAGATV